MCGIAGISLFKPNKNISKKFLNIQKYIIHRGPENIGLYSDPNLTLLHTRLSIVDVEGGSQPIENHNFVLVANGEIYNDLEIRKKNKIKNNYKYITNSDSESILALYKEGGVEAIKELRGMYAFSIYDKKKNEVIIARDPFGIKPLYFSLSNHGIYFCSEMKGLKNIASEKLEIDNFKIQELMQLQYSTGFDTVYKNIKRVAPGQVLVIKKGRIIKSFTNKLPKKKKILKYSDDYIEKSIKESISTHLRSDVPLCIFFSGGIDSMLLLHYLNKLEKKNVTAYSIFFKDTPSFYLKKLTANYKIDLIDENFSESDFWNWIFFAAKYIDEPIADYAILPTFKLASIASKHYKVAITGEGGDELFGGYGRYKKTQRFFFKKRNFIPSGEFRGILKNKFENWEYKVKNFNSFLNNDYTILQRFQLFDYHNWLPNNLLIKLDRCLMAFGMEGRTPFVDKKLFENLFYIDDKKKINNGFGKFYIRKLLEKNIPYYNSFNKKKGFTVPIYDWIPKKIGYLEDLLLKQKFLLDFFTKEEIMDVCKSVKNNKKFSKPLWHIIFFTAWYLVNVNSIKNTGNFFDILSDCK